MTLDSNMTVPDFQQYPWKPCLIKYKLYINFFLSLNFSLSFAVPLRKCLVHFLFIRTNRETYRNKHLSFQKKDGITHICFIRLRFQGYHCKLGIVIPAWRVTWNYAYSPFKIRNKLKLFNYLNLKQTMFVG